MVKAPSKYGRKKLRDILPFLQTFKELRPAQRGILLAHLDDSSCEILCDAVANVLKNPKVNSATRKKLGKSLNPHKVLLRKLANPKESTKSKRKILYKVGGFPLASILTAAVPLLLNLFSK